MYKSYISSTLPEDTNAPNKVFLLLRLQCPTGSYDVNIEPAKNEVMFEDSGLVLDLFEKLCKIAYGDKKDVLHKTKRDSSKKQSDQTVDFNVLLAKKTDTDTVVQQPIPSPKTSKTSEAEDSSNTLLQPKQTKTFRNMFDIDNEELLALEEEEDTPKQHELSEETEDVMDPKITNPFTLARLNSIVKPSRSLPTGVSAQEPRHAELNSRSVQPERDSVATIFMPDHSALLPSPSPSPERNTPYQNPGPPNRPWKTRQNREDEDEEDVPSPTVTTGSESTRPTLLDSWATSVNSSSPQQQSASTTEVRRSEPIFLPARTSDGPTGNAVRSKSPSKRPVGLSSGQQSAFQTPFKKSSKAQSSSPIPFNHSAGPFARRPQVQNGEPVSPADTTIDQFPGFERPRMLLDSELEDIMDFEHRKKSTIQEHKKRAKQLRVGFAAGERDQAEQRPRVSLPLRPEREGPEPIDQEASYGSKFGDKRMEDEYDDIPPQPNSAGYTQNPHRNRQKKAIRNLEERGAESGRPSPDLETTDLEEPEGHHHTLAKSGNVLLRQHVKLSPKDPRAYLIRQIQDRALQGSTSGQKKMSTTKLPFETIEAGLATYTFIQVFDLEKTGDIEQMSRRTETLGRVDSYVRSGTISSDLVGGSITQDVLQELESRVRELLSAADVAQSRDDSTEAMSV